MKFPFVTFIIPTYNAEKYLELCLKSIEKQNYPKNCYEVFVVDGGSTDRTRDIARRFGVRIINNPARDPETAKSIGIQKSKGEIIILLDSDNEIVKKDWLKKMAKPLIKDSSLFGVESFYYSKKRGNIFNEYCMAVHIADPLSRCLASRLKTTQKKEYTEYEIPKNGTFPLGANGFLWNKKIIEKVGKYEPKFEESNFGYFAKEAGFRRFARVPGYGVYHYHINSLKDFINKRLKIGNKFLNRKDEKKRTWLEGVPRIKLIVCGLYCISIIGPLVEGLINLIKTGEKAWLLHPVMSFVSISTYSLVYIRRTFLK